MQVSKRLGQFGLVTGLVFAMLAGGSHTVGPQDITGMMKRQAGLAERVRLSVLSGSLHTLKASTFAWPARSSLLSGSAISEPPRVASLSVDINRPEKADRLASAPAVAPAPGAAQADLFTAGEQTPPGVAGSGTGTGDVSSPAGAGTGTGAVTVAGMGTDPAETEDSESPSAAAQAIDGVYSVSAGDPTGDPAQLEDAAVAFEYEDNDTVAEAVKQELPLYRQSAFIFGYDSAALPPQPFLHIPGMQDDGGTSEAAKSGELSAAERLALGPSPAERLGLTGKRLERSMKCLAEAVYYESRGEPHRGQVAVAQVVINRVFSGYYPSDICRAVYQNAHRKLACQFTFACDNVKDVVNETELWDQAREIASDMLWGRIWDEKVGRATHYHARSVRPNWIREMRTLDRIGEHTFYRPRRWSS